MNLSAVVAVIRFELQRMLTTARITGWVALAGFPPLITLLLVLQARGNTGWETMVMFVLIPNVLCLLSLLLWVTPLVFSELEGRSWIYLASRPGGRTSVMLGKYFAGVLRTVLAGWAAITLCTIIARPPHMIRDMGVMYLTVVAASFTYGALYTLIGVTFHRRATVIAAAYTMIIEVAVSWVPAVINQLTVAYHLRSVFADLIGQRPAWKQQFSSASPWSHLLFMLVLSTTFLFLANLVLNRSQYVKADDGTV